MEIKTKGDKKEPVQGYSSNLISCNPVAEAPNAQKEKDAQGSLSFPVYVYYSQNSQTHFSVAGRRRQFKFEPPSPVSTVQLLSWSDLMSSSHVALLSEDAALLLRVECRRLRNYSRKKQQKTNKVFTSLSTLMLFRPKPAHCGEEEAKSGMVEFE